jgi:tetratricopeptide (TPR) repeat protein
MLYAAACGHAALWAQAVDFNITGAGARASGVGQAFIGVADDATAVVWNPGGLTTLERMEASIVGRHVSDVRDYTNDNFTNIDRLDVDNSHFVLNFASFAYPMTVMGAIYAGESNYQKAIDCYNILLQGNPRFFTAYKVLGTFYWALGQNEKVLEYMSKYIQKNPSGSDIDQVIGWMNMIKGQ